MTSLRFDSQPDFPARDISYAVASALAETLRGETLNERHEYAEANNYGFRISHSILNRALQSQIDDPTKRMAFSDGIGIYESVFSSVRPQSDFTDTQTTTCHVLSMDESLSSPEYRRTLRSAKDEFDIEMPNTSLLIASLALSAHEDFTIAGAAVARRVQLAAINDLSAFEEQFPGFDS
jgi:hypothetical protein